MKRVILNHDTSQANMNSMPHTFRRCLCLILVFCLILATTPLRAQKPAGTPTPAAGSASSDPGWPREVKQDGARLVYYQPQIDEWKDYRELTGDMAVSLTPAGGQPTLGVASLSASTMADLEKRTVVIRSIQITSSRFPSADKATADSLDRLLRQLFPSAGMTISLDRILAGLQRTKTSAKPVAVKTDPPRIFYSKGPAIMLLVDGEPVRAPIEKTATGVCGQHKLGSLLRQEEQKLLPPERQDLAFSFGFGRTLGGDRQAARRKCPSCRPTRTGMTSRRRFLPRSLQPCEDRRCSSRILRQN